MEQRLESYRRAGIRAVEFQLQYQQPDGSFIWDPSIRDAYHKQCYSWGIAGFAPQAHRLITWIRDHTLRPEGDLEGYRGDVYKLAWLLQGVHRLGRFDLSHPLWRWLRAQQAECGGFPHFPGADRLRSLPSAWAGVAAVYMGDLEVATGVAEWCISLHDQQADDGRFYFQTDPGGKLLSQDAGGQFIDYVKPQQPYWEIGLPSMLMGRLYQATGEEAWLEWAGRFFDLHFRCAEDRFSATSSGKSSLCAAVHYVNTGDERARDAALTFGDFLIETQLPQGSWRGPTMPDEPLYHIDAAAEFNVWLQELAAALHAGQ